MALNKVIIFILAVLLVVFISLTADYLLYQVQYIWWMHIVLKYLHCRSQQVAEGTLVWLSQSGRKLPRGLSPSNLGDFYQGNWRREKWSIVVIEGISHGGFKTGSFKEAALTHGSTVSV